MRANITADFLKKLPPGPCEIRDTKCPGLLIRVRTSGRAYWAIVQGRGAGARETIGRVDSLAPAEARALAHQIIGQAAKDRARGENPRELRRQRRAQQRAATLGDFVRTSYDAWARAHHKTGAETVARVQSAFSDLLTEPIPQLTTFRLESWRTARRRAGVRDTTINRDLDALRGVLSRAKDWGVIAEHPMRHVRRTKVDILGRIRFLSLEEETRLRAALAERDEARRDARRRFNAWRAERGQEPLPDYAGYVDHMTPVVLLALNSGLRRGELLALRWIDVDLVARRLTVRGASAKSGLTRHIPLNTEAVAVLQAWQPLSGDGLVFPGPTGEPMADIKTAWGKVVKAAALRAFTFHDLRHTFASKLVQAGVDLNTVRELLGHADIRMTLRYAHLAPEHTAAAVEKLVAP